LISLIREEDRNHCARRLIELCKVKEYRLETHFLAIRIFDRYLQNQLHIIEHDDLPLLMTTSIILAAKLEQPMTPSIRRMIKLLAPEEQELVEKESVILLEE